MKTWRPCSSQLEGRSPFLFLGDIFIRLPVNNLIHLNSVGIANFFNNANIRQSIRVIAKPICSVVGNSDLLSKLVRRQPEIINQNFNFVPHGHCSSQKLPLPLRKALTQNITHRLRNFQSPCSILNESLIVLRSCNWHLDSFSGSPMSAISIALLHADCVYPTRL